MKTIIRFVKRIFGKYEPGYEYWVKLDDIHIPYSFSTTIIGRKKYNKKWQFYHRNGYCESKIILDNDFVLIDGYSSYKIYRASEGIDCKVPVWFLD